MNFLLLMQGAAAALSLVIALFFARMWTRSSDRFYLFFAIAFVILSVHWCVLAGHAGEHAFYPYLTRLVSFIVIITAIVDKNRRAAKES
jgi:uncharacterized membrane protein